MANNFHKFLFLVVLMVMVTLSSNALTTKGLILNSGGASYVREPGLPALASALPSLLAGSALPAGESFVSETSSVAGAPAVDVAGTLNMTSTVDTAIRQPAASVSGAAESPVGGGALSGGSGPSVLYKQTGDGTPPALGAEAVLVADLTSGERFYGYNLDQRWPLASLTKLFSGAVAWDQIAPTETLTLNSATYVSENVIDPLKPGDRYGVPDLFKAMFMISSNEAAQSFADFYGGEKFVSLMNDYAARWGLKDTYLVDPTGLSSSDQSTVSDLEKLAYQIYGNYRGLLTLTRTTSGYIRELNSNRRLPLANINNFAGRSDFLGGKTGYTDEARGNLLSIFSYEKRPLLIIVLGSSDRFSDTQKLLEWFKNNYR